MPVNNPSGGYVITPLENNAFAYDDPISDYPMGLSCFLSDLDQDPNFLGDLDHNPATVMVLTLHSFEDVSETHNGFQLVLSVGDALLYRSWVDEWDASFSAFPPQIAGTPSEGDVVTYVSGVPTWAAP